MKKLVLITGASGDLGTATAYKFALVTLTKSLAPETKSGELNMNSLLPGTINTPTNRNDIPNADFTTWVPCYNLVNTMLYLSSELANSVNAAIIPVYGKS